MFIGKIVFALLFASCGDDVRCGPKHARVRYVIDGDTLYTEQNTKVRYLLIDAPELAHGDKTGECYALESQQQNEQWVQGKDVRFSYENQCVDIYKRLLAYVWVGSELINEKLVAQGFARSYLYLGDEQYATHIVEAQRQAKQKKYGLWGACRASP